MSSFMGFGSAPLLGEFSRANPAGELIRFEVRVEPEVTPGLRQWSFMVKPVEPGDDSGEFYYAGVKEIEPGLVQLEATRNDLPDRFHHCGITCGLVPMIAELTQARIRSSKNPPLPAHERVAQQDEMRSEAAEKVWKRMLAEGNATYDAHEDRYYYQPPG